MQSNFELGAHFSDKIPPVLVKELRQSLRSFWSTVSFLLIQGVFLLTTLISGFATAPATAFLLLCSAIFLAAIPFQVSNCLATEVRQHTLELVLITRISATQLVWEKWFSTVLRSTILACTIIPYILLQQLLSPSSDVFYNLEAFGLIFLAGMILSALAISLSVYRSVFLRALEFGILLVCCFAVFFMIGFSGTLTDFFLPTNLLMIVVDSGLLITVLLEAGAARIASFTENHACLMRLSALFALGFATVLAYLGIPALVAYGTASGIILFTLLEGLSLPNAFAPLQPRHQSLVQRLAFYFFAPGWASSALFSVLVFLVSWKVLQWEKVTKEPRIALLFASLFAGVIWPAALIRFLSPKIRNFAIAYCLYQFTSGILALLILSIHSEANGFWDVLLCFAPATVFLLTVTGNLPPTGLDIYLWVTVILCCLSLLLLIARVALIVNTERRQRRKHT